MSLSLTRALDGASRVLGRRAPTPRGPLYEGSMVWQHSAVMGSPTWDLGRVVGTVTVWALWPGWSLLFSGSLASDPGEDPRTPLQCIRKCWVSQVNPFRLCPTAQEWVTQGDTAGTGGSGRGRGGGNLVFRGKWKTVLPFSHIENIS